MNTIVDKISILQLGVAGVGSGFFNWIFTNNVGFWITLVTGLLILLLTIRKFIVTIASDYRKWKAGKLFEDDKPNPSENGKM